MYLHALDALAQPQEKQPTDEQLLCRRDMLVQEQVFENLEQDLALTEQSWKEAMRDLAKCQAALKAAQRKTRPPKNVENTAHAPPCAWMNAKRNALSNTA